MEFWWGFIAFLFLSVALSAFIEKENSGDRELRNLTEEYQNETNSDSPISRGRIAKGAFIDITQRPYQVQLRVDIAGDIRICGGSIFDASNIITAAHCLYERGQLVFPAWITVIAGRTQENDPLNGGVEHRVVKFCLHNKYNDILTDSAYDIAILALETPIDLSTDRAKTITLEQNLPTRTGATFTVSGYGSEEHALYLEQQRPLMRLKITEVEVIANSVCEHMISSADFSRVFPAGFPRHQILILPQPQGPHRTQFCSIPKRGLTTVPTGKSCKGDSGGPLVCSVGIRSGQTVVYTEEKLCGIDSLSWGCDVYVYPSIYTDVTQFVRWINQNVLRGTSFCTLEGRPNTIQFP